MLKFFCPQLVKYVVQLVFLCWGIFLCCTFLYGGYQVMRLLRNMPSELLQQEPPDHQRKGTEINVLLLDLCMKALNVMTKEAVYI